MTLFTTAELDDLQALRIEAMPDMFALLADTPVYDSEGGMTTTETTANVGVCRLRTLASTNERTTADRLEWTAAYAVDLPLTVTVTPAQRLRINSTRTFEIGAVLTSGAWARSRTAICQEVNP